MGNLFSLEKFIDILTKYWPYYQTGIIYTIALTLVSVIIGVVFALVIVAFRMSKIKILKFISIVYVEIIRGTPLMVQIFIVYLGVFTAIDIPSFKILGYFESTRFIPGVVAISINSAAYVSELIRAGIQAVDQGQTEAARSLGLNSFQTMTFVVIPQAIKNIIPALANEFVVLIKETSICSVIGVAEISYAGNLVVGASYRPLEPLLIAAILYLCLTVPTSKIIAYFERRMRRGDIR